jgi:hypothetical protein
MNGIEKCERMPIQISGWQPGEHLNWEWTHLIQEASNIIMKAVKEKLWHEENWGVILGAFISFIKYASLDALHYDVPHPPKQCCMYPKTPWTMILIYMFGFQPYSMLNAHHNVNVIKIMTNHNKIGLYTMVTLACWVATLSNHNNNNNKNNERHYQTVTLTD